MSMAHQFLTDEDGTKTAVIVPIEDYARFMEDMEDLAAVAERREVPTIKHENFLAELKRDGLLRDHVALIDEEGSSKDQAGRCFGNC